MRVLPVFVLAAALVGLVPSAAADHPGTCPDYTVHSRAEGHEIGVNERGQFLVGAQGFYMTWDYTVGVTGFDHLFSWWFYQETNGREGLQRDDEFCSNVHEGEEADGGCFC